MASIHLPKTEIESIHSLSLFGYTNGYGDTDGAGYFEGEVQCKPKKQRPFTYRIRSFKQIHGICGVKGKHNPLSGSGNLPNTLGKGENLPMKEKTSHQGDLYIITKCLQVEKPYQW